MCGTNSRIWETQETTEQELVRKISLKANIITGL